MLKKVLKEVLKRVNLIQKSTKKSKKKKMLKENWIAPSITESGFYQFSFLQEKYLLTFFRPNVLLFGMFQGLLFAEILATRNFLHRI